MVLSHFCWICQETENTLYQSFWECPKGQTFWWMVDKKIQYFMGMSHALNSSAYLQHFYGCCVWPCMFCVPLLEHISEFILFPVCAPAMECTSSHDVTPGLWYSRMGPVWDGPLSTPAAHIGARWAMHLDLSSPIFLSHMDWSNMVLRRALFGRLPFRAGRSYVWMYFYLSSYLLTSCSL